MSKTDTVCHKRSSVITDGIPKQPTTGQIDYGEIAINYAANGETLYIKNSENAIAKFKDDKYYQKQLSEKTDKTLSLTYSELVSLRDNSQLIPGQQYRITDYTCTTSQANTRSAGHQFDIIVTADDESTLNEEARAALHTGDEYFSGCNLSVWKIWYCLDNDTTRFAWADATNGKGVIYRMIDEFNNDIPYDFKNIQFYRQWDSSKSLWSTISSDTTGVPCYTFSSEGDSSTVEFTDMSLSLSNNVYSNVIKEYISFNFPTRDELLTLNNNCFFGRSCYSNTFGISCYENTFGSDCFNNTFGSDCDGNTFGGNCYFNTFGDNCKYNTFGNWCCNNTFGNSIIESQFGNGVKYFSITNVQMTTKPTSANVKSYIQWLIVENGVKNVNAYVTGSTSSSSYCQNIRICQGCSGTTYNNRKSFDITSCIGSTVNNIYQPANSQITNI